MPTEVDRRAYAQFTDSVVACWTVTTRPPPSTFVVLPSKPGTLHGPDPSTCSFREYPSCSIAANATTLKLDPTCRPAPSTAILNLDWLYGRLSVIAFTSPVFGSIATSAAPKP